MKDLTTAILSDAGDELGFELVCDHKPTLRAKRVLIGRARTLKLRGLIAPKEMGSVHEALQTYKFMNRGDVVVVERGDDPDRAYFGALNAALARRAGAVGAVIDGRTRDDHALPTWSTGRTPRDCKYYASVESYDQPIDFAGLRVTPGSLVVADNDGVAFVPLEHESEILRLAEQIAEREAKVEGLIWSGWEIDSIIRECGDF